MSSLIPSQGISWYKFESRPQDITQHHMSNQTQVWMHQQRQLCILHVHTVHNANPPQNWIPLTAWLNQVAVSTWGLQFTHRLEWLCHAAARSNHAYTLSTKSEVRQKHDILTFNFQSNAKFDAKNNFFAMRLSPTVDPWEPRGSITTGYPATSALVRTHP